MAPPTSLSPQVKSPSPSSNSQNANPTEEEDDYLTMDFAEPTSTTTSTTTRKETLIQATKRKQREAELRSRPKPKAELAAEAAAKRDEGLARSTLDPTSKGFQMMKKLGYTPGSALGRVQTPITSATNGGTFVGGERGLLEPVGIEIKEGRSGIGADAEKKRKMREGLERMVEGEKRQRVEVGEFRERVRGEREERRREGLLLAAQRVAERLEEDGESGNDEGVSDDSATEDGGADMTRREAVGKRGKNKPLQKINVLWRGAIKQRELAERDRRIRYGLHQSLSRLPTYEDPDEDKEDRMALGKKDTEEVDLGLDQTDDELDEFDRLDSGDKLQKLVEYLRNRWHYCFWCKYRYENRSLEGCPGTTEDDHD